MTQILTRSEGLIYGDINACEGCPDINPDPPKKSECPYFDGTGEVPVCRREGNMDDQLREFFAPPSIGRLSCGQAVESIDG